MQKESEGVTDYNCGKQSGNFTAPEKDGKNKYQYGMERNSRSYADKCSDSNSAGQNTWMTFLANESQVIVSGCTARLKFHWQ